MADGQLQEYLLSILVTATEGSLGQSALHRLKVFLNETRNWRKRPALILRISTFDPNRLQPSDLIDIPRAASSIFLDVFGYYPRPGGVPWGKISFRAADSPHTRLRGFLYYHVPVPARPLSGGLRFRCTPAAASTREARGADLLTPSGLPGASRSSTSRRTAACPSCRACSATTSCACGTFWRARRRSTCDISGTRRSCTSLGSST
jgi:hypothetical protein